MALYGLDLGTTGIKGSGFRDGVWSTVTVETLIANQKKTTIKKTSRLTAQQGDGSVDILEYNGEVSHIGRGLTSASGVYQPIAQSRFYDGSLLPFVLVAIAKLNPTYEEQISLELSLPVSVMESHTDLLEGIGAWILGKFEYKVNGLDYSVIIENFDFDNQPLHAFIGLTHNEACLWVHEKPSKSTFVIFDDGGGTFDFTTLSDYIIDEQLSGGGQFGFYEGAKLLKQRLKDAYKLILPLYQTNDFIQKAAEGREVTVFVNGRYVPESNETGLVSVNISKQCLADLATSLNKTIQFVSETITTEMAEGVSLYLVGGPANLPLVSDRFRLEYPNIIVDKNRHLAAQGAWIFGTMRQQLA